MRRLEQIALLHDQALTFYNCIVHTRCQEGGTAFLGEKGGGCVPLVLDLVTLYGCSMIPFI